MRTRASRISVALFWMVIVRVLIVAIPQNECTIRPAVPVPRTFIEANVPFGMLSIVMSASRVPAPPTTENCGAFRKSKAVREGYGDVGRPNRPRVVLVMPPLTATPARLAAAEPLSIPERVTGGVTVWPPLKMAADPSRIRSAAGRYCRRKVAVLICRPFPFAQMSMLAIVLRMTPCRVAALFVTIGKYAAHGLVERETPPLTPNVTVRPVAALLTDVDPGVKTVSRSSPPLMVIVPVPSWLRPAVGMSRFGRWPFV